MLDQPSTGTVPELNSYWLICTKIYNIIIFSANMTKYYGVFRKDPKLKCRIVTARHKITRDGVAP
jgi:hypothetical protein